MKFFDRAVELTKPVQALADNVRTWVEQVKSLTETISIIAHNQAVHHNMIMQMWTMQQTIVDKLSSNNLDINMPDIEGKKDTKKDQSN